MVEIVKSTAAIEIILVVDKIFLEFSIPSVVRLDNNPPFNSNDFHLFAKKFLGLNIVRSHQYGLKRTAK